MLRVRAGDREAFNVLAAEYRTPAVHFLYRMVRESALAEELAQEVFLRIYRARKSYRPRAKFSTWLFRLATNVALHALRDGRMRRARESSLEGETEDAGPAMQVADPGGNVGQRMLEAEG